MSYFLEGGKNTLARRPAPFVVSASLSLSAHPPQVPRRPYRCGLIITPKPDTNAASSQGRPRRRSRRVLADKAYSSQANRAWLRAHHIRATIPVKADQAVHRHTRGSRGGRPPTFDAVMHKNRNTVERGFSLLKHHQALATRYDKLAVRYQATIHVTSINHWLKRHT